VLNRDDRSLVLPGQSEQESLAGVNIISVANVNGGDNPDFSVDASAKIVV